MALLLSAWVSLVAAPPAAAQSPEGGPGPTSRAALVLLDASAAPRVQISWPTVGGDRAELAGERVYGADADRVDLGRNVSAFVASGGTRLRTGAGHPRGAVVRVGFYKIESDRPFFDSLPPDARIDVVMTGVRFNQTVVPRPDSPVQHLKYNEEDLEACGISATSRDQYNLASTEDTLNNRISPGINARQGVLDGSEADDGRVELVVEDDGSITMRASIPYALLRHLSDPWRSSIPGTFIEPQHFHIEFEVLAEGVIDERPGSAD